MIKGFGQGGWNAEILAKPVSWASWELGLQLGEGGRQQLGQGHVHKE